MTMPIIQGGYPKYIQTDIEYEYEVNIKKYDIVDYLMPQGEKDKGKANYYMTKMLEFLLECGAVDESELENDEYFVEFMKERYEEQAKEEWESCL